MNLQAINKYRRENDREGLKNFLMKNASFSEMVEMLSDFIFRQEEETKVEKIRITDEQFKEFFSIIQTGKRGRKPKDFENQSITQY